MFNWFTRLGTYQGRTTDRSRLRYMPDRPGEPERIYQCPDAPWVFLGSAEIDDIRAVERITGEKVCFRFDVTDEDTSNLPQPAVKHPFPEFKIWDEQNYQNVSNQFNQTADELAQIIMSRRCPVYVHCSFGMNRSASVLAAALTKVTGKSVFDILREMKSIRGVVSPHDAYFMMAVDYSTNEYDTNHKEEIRTDLNTQTHLV